LASWTAATRRVRKSWRVCSAPWRRRGDHEPLGQRWSKLAVNCMGNALAGLSGLGSAELRLEPGPRRVSIRSAPEVVRVGRAHGHTIEPLIGGIDARGSWTRPKAVAREVEADLAAEAKRPPGGGPSLLKTSSSDAASEVDFLNATSRRRPDEGRATPFNDAIVAACTRIRSTAHAQSKHSSALIAMLPPATSRERAARRA